MVDENLQNAMHGALADYLSAKNMRQTPERFAILDKVCEFPHHFGIDELYSAIEADGYHVSRATIYNTIELLTDAEIVRCHHFTPETTQYELAESANHLHLICSQCGKIKEVKDSQITSLIKSKNFSAFHASHFQLYIHGICTACIRRNRRNKKNNQDIKTPLKT
jgi:Fur family ferric uptake transcriptional regulator